MKQIVRVVMVGALTTFAASSLAQTTTKPPPKPVSAAKPASTAPTARSVAHPVVRHPVFVPAPPVIELDEMAVLPDLPTVLSAIAASSRPRPPANGHRPMPKSPV
jgi:hypothetical protein